MTNHVLQICPSCAENNGATWKNKHNTAPMFLGVCGCCKKIVPCTHIQFWQGIKSDSQLKTPDDLAREQRNTKPRKVTTNKINKQSQVTSDLLGDAKKKAQ